MRTFVEYYDDFFPTSEEQMKFFSESAKDYFAPVKFLNIGSNTGSLAILLAKQGFDVTGTEMWQELLDSASLKRRTQLLSIRFFKLSSSEITRYLGKGFYNIVFNLDGRIPLLGSRDKVENFFKDAKTLLTKNGKLILAICNFDYLKNSNKNTITKESSRAVFKCDFDFSKKDTALLTQKVIHNGDKEFTVLENIPVYPISREELITFSKAAGFSKVNFYSDYTKNPATESTEILLCEFS